MLEQLQLLEAVRLQIQYTNPCGILLLFPENELCICGAQWACAVLPGLSQWRISNGSNLKAYLAAQFRSGPITVVEYMSVSVRLLNHRPYLP